MSALLYLRTQLIFSLIKHSFGVWSAGRRLFPEAPWKLGCLRFWSHKSVQTPGSAGSGGRKGVRSALAGAEGVPCVMPHRGSGGDAGNDRWPVPAVALTSGRSLR